MAERAIVVGPRAAARVLAAAGFLRGRGVVEVIGATPHAGAELLRQAARPAGAAFGWRRSTLPQLAARLAGPLLVNRDLVPVGRLPLEALCAQVTHALGPAGLGRLAPVADRPGLPRALARTLGELRLGGVSAAELDDPDLAAVLRAFEARLAESRLADRARVFALAAEAAAQAPPAALLLHDVPVGSVAERRLLEALAARAPAVLATVPAGDQRSLEHLEAALGVRATPAPPPPPSGLGRLQSGLFGDQARPAERADDVTFLSAPGESRECVELARLLHREAEAGVPFDRMAILLRSPEQYRAHLAEALRRAGIPAYFARGTVEPDPAGRAFLALLACAAEGLSARRFAEYLSLGEVPDATPEGAPPAPRPGAERWVPPDEELAPAALADPDEDPGDPDAAPLPDEPERAPVVGGTVRAPRRWEQLLVDAKVIGGLPRWQRRLGGLAAELTLRRAALEPEEPLGLRLDRDLADLAHLRALALPLVAALEELPPEAPWGAWIDGLGALATRALRRPERVLAVLAELEPMREVGPVDLGTVRLVLHRRLASLVGRPPARRFGRVFVGPIEAARGLVFAVVVVPGLAERMFPQKVAEDPILPDAARAPLDAALDTRARRVEDERLALRLAIGAAETRVVLSYPRLDADQARPRTPSFYGLEVLRATEGRLLGFEELAARAEQAGVARIGWPAPRTPADAIDGAEHDLALLESLLQRPVAETIGTARYLLEANPHLARALRFRARRWHGAWTNADGLCKVAPEARPALGAHALDARAYSPTALEAYAACPYRFLLQGVLRLAPREEAAAVEEMDPLVRGSLIHEVQAELLAELRDAGALPLAAAALPAAGRRLDAVLDRVAARYHDELAPAIDRIWDNGIALVRADLREWLARLVDETRFVPAWFELAFGLPDRYRRDASSCAEPVALDAGLQLRGSIDLVERAGDGALRATDHKTGKARAARGTVIGGGLVLQPVLYALVLERLFPGARVESGRLYYCTATGGWLSVEIPLDDAARDGARALADTLRGAFDEAFLPAAPAQGACTYCDYQVVCGPYEERRVKRKPRPPLVPLERLRSRP